MKVLVTGDPEKSRTKKLLKGLESAGHTVVISAAVGGSLAMQEILMEGESEKLGKAIKVEASHHTDGMKLVTPGKVNNRRSRRSAAALKKRRKRRKR